jgi:hypothetical protein
MSIGERNSLVDRIARETVFPNGITDRDWMLYKLKNDFIKTLNCMNRLYDELTKNNNNETERDSPNVGR